MVEYKAETQFPRKKDAEIIGMSISTELYKLLQGTINQTENTTISQVGLCDDVTACSPPTYKMARHATPSKRQWQTNQSQGKSSQGRSGP